MKKLLFTLMTCAAIVSCSKSDVIYDDFQQEIGFTAVASNSTKSVTGYNDAGVFDGVFPTNIDLYVFANAQDEDEKDGELLSSWNTPYFQNAKFKFNSAKGSEETQYNYATLGAYEGDPARYWPNVKTLKFAGYSDACGVAKNATMNFATNTLTIPSYTQNNETYIAEGTNDLMWFPCDNLPHSKVGKEVPAQMKHACSWITINVFGDDVTATYTTGEGGSAKPHTGWTLNSLIVKSIYHTGNAECGELTATWNTLSNVKDENYYNGSTTFTTNATEYAAVANNFIVIPQTPTSLDVNYTYVSDETNKLSLTETANVSLIYAYEKDQNGNEIKDDKGNPIPVKWQSGYHYIYNVKITATEILIDPVVVAWSEYDHDSNKDGNQPIPGTI